MKHVPAITLEQHQSQAHVNWGFGGADHSNKLAITPLFASLLLIHSDCMPQVTLQAHSKLFGVQLFVTDILTDVFYNELDSLIFVGTCMCIDI
jgi:hypothetical protein